MTRTHASFRGDFPKDRQETAPPGEPLADLIASGFVEGGCVVSGRGSTDYSHTLEVRSGANRYLGMIGLVEDGDREWLFFLEHRPSLLGQLLGRRDEANHLQLLKLAHGCLSGDTRISALRWYTEQEWNTNPNAGTADPVG